LSASRQREEQKFVSLKSLHDCHLQNHQEALRNLRDNFTEERQFLKSENDLVSKELEEQRRQYRELGKSLNEERNARERSENKYEILLQKYEQLSSSSSANETALSAALTSAQRDFDEVKGAFEKQLLAEEERREQSVAAMTKAAAQEIDEVKRMAVEEKERQKEKNKKNSEEALRVQREAILADAEAEKSAFRSQLRSEQQKNAALLQELVSLQQSQLQQATLLSAWDKEKRSELSARVSAWQRAREKERAEELAWLNGKLNEMKELVLGGRMEKALCKNCRKILQAHRQSFARFATNAKKSLMNAVDKAARATASALRNLNDKNEPTPPTSTATEAALEKTEEDKTPSQTQTQTWTPLKSTVVPSSFTSARSSSVMSPISCGRCGACVGCTVCSPANSKSGTGLKNSSEGPKKEEKDEGKGQKAGGTAVVEVEEDLKEILRRSKADKDRSLSRKKTAAKSSVIEDVSAFISSPASSFSTSSSSPSTTSSPIPPGYHLSKTPSTASSASSSATESHPPSDSSAASAVIEMSMPSSPEFAVVGSVDNRIQFLADGSLMMRMERIPTNASNVANNKRLYCHIRSGIRAKRNGERRIAKKKKKKKRR
jgi:hypothetical protein